MLFAPLRSMIVSVEPRERRLPGGAGRCGSDGAGPFVVGSAPAGAPLAALAGGALARKFYGWRGSSGVRHIVNVHPLAAQDWLEIDGAVVLLAEVDLDGRRKAIAIEVDPSPARRRQLRRNALSRQRPGIRLEAHLHLLAGTAAARARVAADLAAALMEGEASAKL